MRGGGRVRLPDPGELGDDHLMSGLQGLEMERWLAVVLLSLFLAFYCNGVFGPSDAMIRLRRPVEPTPMPMMM